VKPKNRTQKRIAPVADAFQKDHRTARPNENEHDIIAGMEKTTRSAIVYALPFAVWMGLMFILPATAESYAIRSAATLAAGIACWILHRRNPGHSSIGFNLGKACLPSVAGLAAGLVVFAIWIWTPAWPYEEPIIPKTSPYAPETCGWALTIAKLAGSAFIIAPAEELFFRSFLYRRLISRDFTSIPHSCLDISAFAWTVLLFTLEHNRPIAAAITGAVYGLLAVRFGISSAIVAHVTTNLVLAVHVICNKAWQFW
jgi:CAAX prenyl protease-like protein